VSVLLLLSLITLFIFQDSSIDGIVVSRRKSSQNIPSFVQDVHLECLLLLQSNIANSSSFEFDYVVVYTEVDCILQEEVFYQAVSSYH
jgi:hypothetical protein